MTLPTPGVWHDHDGSAQCPLPVGTVYDWIGQRKGGLHRKDHVHFDARENPGWRFVARFLVHSYPENHDG